MDWDTIARDWPAFQERILTRWPEADSTELSTMDGDYERFVRHLAEVQGTSVADAAEQVLAWTQGDIPADVVMESEMDDRRISESAAEIPPGEEPLDDDREFGDRTSEAQDAPERPLGRTE